MAQIKDKTSLAGQLKEGLRAVAEQTRTTVERVDQDLASRLLVEARTLKSWKNPSSVPDNLEDEKLLGLSFLVLQHSKLDLAWLLKLLKATSLPIVEPPTREWVRSCFRVARLSKGAEHLFSPPNEAEINQLLQKLFPLVLTHTPGSLPQTHIPAKVGPLTSSQETTENRVELPDGIVAPHSAFYIERSSDFTVLNTLKLPGVTIVIKAPRQMGKSSLLVRAVRTASTSGKRVALLDFQQFDRAALANAELFYRQFCIWLTRLLRLENRVDQYWSEPIGNIQRCTAYLEEYLLPQLGGPVLLAMDEVDNLFDTDFRSDFFGMLRSWHNARQMYPLWQQLDLVLVTSTQPYQLVENLNLSPFNVGVTVELEDFTPEQVAELNQRHGSPLEATALEQLMQLVGGQPYLVRQALYLVGSQRFSTKELFSRANEEHGPFGDHLRYYLQRLYHNPKLIEGLRQVMATGNCQDEIVFWRLQGAGLVKRTTSRGVVMRCQLYYHFFKERLG